MPEHFHHPGELLPPLQAAQRSDAAEVLRAWIVGNGLQVTLAPMAFGGPSSWGLLLVDVARHVARACEQEGHGSYVNNLDGIRKMIEDEFEHPTDLGNTEEARRQ